MNSQQQVQQWLNEMGGGQGRAFRLGGDGSLALESSNGIVLVIQIPATGSSLHLNACLCPVPAGDREPFLYQALALNLFQHETRGAALAIDPNSNQLVLSWAKPVDEIEPSEFSNIVQNLLDTAAKLKKHLRAEPLESSPEAIPFDESLPIGALKA